MKYQTSFHMNIKTYSKVAKAAQLRFPGVFSKQLLGSDIIRYNPYVQVMQNPGRKDNDPVVFIPALYPDVTIIHVHAADRFGNARIYGPRVNDATLAAAARKVIITAEEIVPEIDIRNSLPAVLSSLSPMAISPSLRRPLPRCLKS